MNLAKQLDATLLTVEGIQHTAAWYGNACVDDKVNAYLIDLTLPESDSRCTSEFIPDVARPCRSDEDTFGLDRRAV